MTVSCEIIKVKMVLTFDIEVIVIDVVSFGLGMIEGWLE
jgi:hypothetical protein